MQDESLRDMVRLDKALNRTTYKDLAALIGIKQNSMYNWLNGEYTLSKEKKELLTSLLNNR